MHKNVHSASTTVKDDRPTCRCPYVLSCWPLCPPRTRQFGRARCRPYPLLRNTVGQILHISKSRAYTFEEQTHGIARTVCMSLI
jgi:hypothetical protein